MRLLAIDPFHGGSHRQFLLGVRDNSRHEWEIIPGRPVHWKWRMRSAPLELAHDVQDHVDANGFPDAIFCTDMLDLPTFRGLIRDDTVLGLPTVVYFHENQWSYPVSPHARADDHFGYTNLLSALAADACWFNSEYHCTDFLSQCESFVQRMPDAQSAHDLDSLRQRCEVLPPGFQPREVVRQNDDRDVLTIGWVSRWEYDKRPDLFVELLRCLDQQAVDFRLVLLGARPNSKPKELDEIENRFRGQIIYNGFAETADQYWRLLAQMDVVVSTADHEFFGIAVCEAIWAGAVPVLPNRLSYPELAVTSCLYETIDDAAKLISQLSQTELRSRIREESRCKIGYLTLEQTVRNIDSAIDNLTSSDVLR